MNTPVVRVCAWCYKEHGRPAPPNATHGICRRHVQAAEEEIKVTMRQAGWSEDKIGQQFQIRRPAGEPAPDLGPVVREAQALVSRLLEDNPDDPVAVAAELGLRFDGFQRWATGDYWVFTNPSESGRHPGISFYVAPDSTREQIVARWNEKKAQGDKYAG